jgi:hypothetical protein
MQSAFYKSTLQNSGFNIVQNGPNNHSSTTGSVVPLVWMGTLNANDFI